MSPAPRRPQRGRRRVRKNIPIGQAHIKTSFNNTIISLTDREGNVIAFVAAHLNCFSDDDADVFSAFFEVFETVLNRGDAFLFWRDD